MKIGIIGNGFVGKATNILENDNVELVIYDIDPKLCSPEGTTLTDICKTDIVFISVPTPMNKDGSCHTGIVQAAIERVIKFGTAKTVVIKSTVTPGTCAKWNKKYNIDVVFNPEFLTEANAVSDFENQTRIILGGPRTSTTKLKQIFSKAFPKAAIVKTDSTYAEMVKYVTNSFLATKVSFANEMYEICKGLDVDYDKVIEYACYDERLGKSHWNVPGPDGDLGYGGHCFPKDVKALIEVANNIDIFPLMLIATDEKNEQTRKNKDWKDMKGRAIL